MKINPGINGMQQAQLQQNKKAEQDVKPAKAAEKGAEYLPSDKGGKKVTYDKPAVKKDKEQEPGTKVDMDLINRLKQESEERYASLRRMVEELLARQGMTFKDVFSDSESDSEVIVEVDDITRAEAQAAIAEGGEFSAEAVSDRIVEFAKAISGGDIGKLDLLIGAIDQGFAKAKEMLGGTLPDISQKTYDMIMEKLDAWKNEAHEISA